MSEKYKIEKGIEIPPRHIPHSVFPLLKMEVADSFFVSMADFKATSVYALKLLVYTRIKNFLKETEIDDRSYRIVQQRKNKGIRVFRVK